MDSITDLIGQHINQAAINGKYLDVPTMGEYLELLDILSGEHELNTNISFHVFPNPANQLANVTISLEENEPMRLSLYDYNGKLVKLLDEGTKTSGNHSYEIDLSTLHNGVYLLVLNTNKQVFTHKIIRVD
jgi:hypothetical protein